MTKIIHLKSLPVIANGGGRNVYSHPQDTNALIKVYRNNTSQRRWSFRFEKREFGIYREWYVEQREYIAAVNQIGKVPDFIAEFKGFCATDLGPAQVVEKIIDEDSGQLSNTIHRSAQNYKPEEIHTAVQQFFDKTAEAKVVFRDLHLNNLLIQRNEKGQIAKIVCIDGLGDFTFIKLRKLSDRAYQRWLDGAREKVHKQVDALIA